MKLAYWRDAYIYAEFQRIGRFLMAEEPSEAEHYAAFPHKEVGKQINVEGSVVRMVDSRAPHQPGYMIFHRGTPYTTSTAPPGYEGPIIDVEIPKSKGMILRHLRRIARLLHYASPQMFETLKVASSLTDIEAWCAAANPIIKSSETVIPEILGKLRDPSAAPKNIVDGAEDLINSVMAEFMSLRIPGTASQKVGATLMFFLLYPDKDLLKQLILRCVVGHDYSSDSFNELSAEMFLIPRMNILEYVISTSLGTVPSFITAREAARLLSQKGRSSCLSALSTYTVGEFHNYIYAALFYYRGALEIYSKMKLLRKHSPRIWDDCILSEGEIHRCWVEAEEMRVTIGASLSQAALTWRGAWNIARPYRMFRNVIRLIAVEGNAAAIVAVRDLTVRLVCPKFVQDMLLAFIAIQQDDRLDSWRSRIENIIGELEVALRRCVLQGEPAYLEYAYTIGADLAEKSKDMNAFAEFTRRRELLPSRLSKFFGEANRSGERTTGHCHGEVRGPDLD